LGGADDPSVVWSQTFRDKTSVPWPDIARLLHDHFVQVAKVDYRPLSQTDLQVIKEKLEKDEVTLQAFSLLWRWFRSLEDSINLIRDDWFKLQPKVIYGILTRAQTDVLLRDSPVGTFILRFSEKPENLGCLVLGYVEDKKSIVHSLIDIKSGKLEMKTSGKIFHFSSLAELVTSCKPLRLLYPGHDKNIAFRQEEDDDPH